MSEKYVRHISGQGDTWKVGDEYGQSMDTWRVVNTKKDFLFLYLPKSEYVLIEPPEVWTDVTAECDYDADGAICGPPYEVGGSPIIGNIRQGEGLQKYRLRKVQLGIASALGGIPWAFIVEKKDQP